MRISSTRSRQASGKATGKVTPINVLRQCHEISDVVVATDAGILSAGNLNAFDDVGLWFSARAPQDDETKTIVTVISTGR